MTGPSREEILAAFPLAETMEKDGLKLIGSGNPKTVLCPFHKEKTPSLSVNIDKNLWHCFGCHKGGSIIDYISFRDGKPPETVLKELAEKLGRTGGHIPSGPGTGKVVATYVYQNATGQDVYQVLRYEPKTFKQQKWTGKEWAWGMEGVHRVLYKLPEVLAAGDKPVVICEGEKDCELLWKIGWIATTNVGGAGKWMDGYSDALKGRAVVCCGDNDEPGKKHIAAVIEALDGKCTSLRHVVVPPPHKDISEYLALFGSFEAKKQAFDDLFAKAAVMVAGATVPILSMAEMEARYKEQLLRGSTGAYSFKTWLPTFGYKIRPSMPGDVICFVASTGSGKTALLQNMMWRAAPLPSLLFEMELADAVTFERFVSGTMGLTQEEVESEYLAGRDPDWRDAGWLSNIYVCPSSGLTANGIETIIEKAELKMGVKPVLVGIDYAQLVVGLGKSRYEKITSVMSDIKTMAKNTGTVVAITSQTNTRGRDAVEIGISDGKDSGQIENSSGLQIGAWRDPKDDDTLILRVNKNTRGRAGMTLRCNWDAARMMITEKTERIEA